MGWLAHTVIDDTVTIAGMVAIAQIASDTVTTADPTVAPVLFPHHRHQALPVHRRHHQVVRRQMLLMLEALVADVAPT